MQAAGTKRQKRRDHRGIAGKRSVRSEIIEGADFECPVQLYNTLPMYEDIDLEHIKEITKQRQRALNIIDCKLEYQSHIKSHNKIHLLTRLFSIAHRPPGGIQIAHRPSVEFNERWWTAQQPARRGFFN